MNCIMKIDKHYSIIDRIKLCWAILSNKEFYACVVVSRYDDGSPLWTRVFCYGKDTITYKKKLIKALKQDIEMDKFYNQNHRGIWLWKENLAMSLKSMGWYCESSKPLIHLVAMVVISLVVDKTCADFKTAWNVRGMMGKA